MVFIDKTKLKITEDKLKTLIPTLRSKKRFIRFQIQSPKPYSFKEFEKEYQETLMIYMGVLNFSKAGVWLLKDKFDEKNQQFILRCNVKFEQEICGISALIEEINNQKINIKSLNISGTLKQVQDEPRKNKKE